MKQRITVEDISGLSESQKQAVNDLWIPAIYDVVVAEVCTDVSEDQYEKISFVVGGIEIYHRTGMLLHDIRFIESEKNKEAAENIEKPSQESSDSNDPDPSLSVSADAFPSISSNYLNEAFDSFTAPLKDPEAEEEIDEDYEFAEDDIDFSYTRPTAFNKEDCIPLLTIGQMIEMLEKKGFGYGDFYLAAGINDIGCEIGKTFLMSIIMEINMKHVNCVMFCGNT